MNHIMNGPMILDLITPDNQRRYREQESDFTRQEKEQFYSAACDGCEEAAEYWRARILKKRIQFYENYINQLHAPPLTMQLPLPLYW